MTVEIALGEGTPVQAYSKLVAFDGGVAGRTTTILIHAYLSAPVNQALVVPITLTKLAKGGYGMLAQSTIPKIAAGTGSLARFDLTLRRQVTTAAGKKHDYLLARCSDGNFVFEPEVEFDDGQPGPRPARAGLQRGGLLALRRPGVFEALPVGALELLVQHLFAGAVGGGGDQAPHQLCVDAAGPFGPRLGGADQVAETHVRGAPRLGARLGVELGRRFEQRIADPGEVTRLLVLGKAVGDGHLLPPASHRRAPPPAPAGRLPSRSGRRPGCCRRSPRSPGGEDDGQAQGDRQ